MTLRFGLRHTVATLLVAGQLAALANPALAFCGFYVAKADAKLFNKSSKVVLAWDHGKTAITMASDYEGDPREFALVVPVPTFIERDQIRVVEMAPVDHLDAYTAPRLVEYFDPDPCASIVAMSSVGAAAAAGAPMARRATKSLDKVTVEATYAVGVYDISILKAEESDGLVDWLDENGYRIPPGTGDVLHSYIRQHMRFFVAKVNLDRQAASGQAFLRPLQVTYSSPKFMLPIRLGTVNAPGPQDLIVYALTRRGRVETSNYRTVKLPTGNEVPLFVKADFGRFYKATFDRAVEREDGRAVFLEYAWDMNWCDPCAADPLSADELRGLGASWVAGDGTTGAAESFVTRLHVRYDAAHFPEDLMLNETKDRANFQGRYVLRHPYLAAASCPAGQQYRATLPARFRQEALMLNALTGWPQSEIRDRMAANGEVVIPLSRVTPDRQ
jgi:hypothetical protein